MNIWLQRVAILSLLGFPIAVVGARFDLFSLNISLLVAALSFLLAVLVFFMGAFLSLKQKGLYPVSARNALVAMIISLIPLLGIGSIIVAARDIPRIHNISTDVVDPPAFVKIKELRSSEDNSLDYDVDKITPLQQSAYPNIETLSVNMNRAQAHERALNVIIKLGWDLVDDNRPMGIIEASHTTRLWGFTDDIVIRLRSNSNDDQVSIDLRSVSRVGQSDLGANAKRIESFINDF